MTLLTLHGESVSVDGSPSAQPAAGRVSCRLTRLTGTCQLLTNGHPPSRWAPVGVLDDVTATSVTRCDRHERRRMADRPRAESDSICHDDDQASGSAHDEFNRWHTTQSEASKARMAAGASISPLRCHVDSHTG